MKYNPNNIFAKIIEGKIPAHKIFETEHCVAILDAFPLAKGHALLLPKAPVVNLFDMPPDVASKVMAELPRLCNAVKEATNATGVTVVSNNGSSSGQIVFHSHFHVVPRYDHDGLVHYKRTLPPLSETEDEAKEILATIQSKLS